MWVLLFPLLQLSKFRLEFRFSIVSNVVFQGQEAYCLSKKADSKKEKKNDGGGVDAATIKQIEDAFKTLAGNPQCKSLLKKHLTQSVVDKLKNKKTKLGASLFDVIRSGM